MTLGAFWLAVVACAIIVAFSLLAPREPVVLLDETPPAFTVGSTRQQVRAIQGEPLAVEGNVWRYGDSTVYFDGNMVVGWRMGANHPLKVEPPPRKKP